MTRPRSSGRLVASVPVEREAEDQPAQSSIIKRFDETRGRLVETGTRNRLIHVNRANTRGNALNIVNAQPDDLHPLLAGGKTMLFLATVPDKDEDRGGSSLGDAQK
jgi:hypothetical protein